LISVTKMPDMLLNFPRCVSILLLQTSKTDNNALDIDAIYNLKLRKHNLIQQIKLNAKFPWPKQREWTLCFQILLIYFFAKMKQNNQNFFDQAGLNFHTE
jgi:hypothetical protein